MPEIDFETGYNARPWVAQYPDGDAPEILVDEADIVEMFRCAVDAAGEAVFLRYFDAAFTWNEVDRKSDAFARALQESGVVQGDRVSVFMQNIPQAVIAMIASWKAGATVHLVNPMMRERELIKQFGDITPKVLVTHEYLFEDVVQNVYDRLDLSLVVTTSELDYLREPPTELADRKRYSIDEVSDFLELLDRWDGQRPTPVRLEGSHIAQVMYTSGSTGEPKAAMSTHTNVVFNAYSYKTWLRLDSQDVCYAISPLVHVTGAVAFLGAAIAARMPLVMAYRFFPDHFIRATEEHRVSYTITTHTALVAVMDHPAAQAADLTSLSKIHSGVVDEVLDRWARTVGTPVSTGYGSTECTSAVIWVPLGVEPPRDPDTGKRSIGVPMYNTVVRIVDDNGDDVPVGELGEMVVEGPQVGAGYWNRPDVEIFRNGIYFTGDIGYMNADGWFFILDRKRDMIDASGFKVSPVEVENVLYEHPAILDAAVIGVPDDKRGQTVKAFVTLRAGAHLTEAELIEFCKESMAAYKYPRFVEILEQMPKSSIGKILKAELS